MEHHVSPHWITSPQLTEDHDPLWKYTTLNFETEHELIIFFDGQIVQETGDTDEHENQKSEAALLVVYKVSP